MNYKKCSKCKKEKPNTEEFFHLDKAKVKLGHNIILSAGCKKCNNAEKRIYSAKKRKEQIAKYGSTYAYRLTQDKDHLKKCNKREKRYSVKKLERNKKYRKEKRDYILKADKIRAVKNKKEVEEITDYYVARLIYRNDKTISINELLKNKEFIELYRLNLKLKRLCLQ
jgi:hypothetical protein